MRMLLSRIVAAVGLVAILVEVFASTYHAAAEQAREVVHASGNIVFVIGSTSASGTVLTSSCGTLYCDHFEYTRGAATTSLISDLKVTARIEPWVPPTVR